MQVSAKAEARFWAKVNKTPGHGPQGDCWVWTGSTEENGYGRFWLQSLQFAHRVAFLIHHGRLPKGLARHTCDYRACVNPEHIVEGTHNDNMQDAIKRGRLPYGERNHSAVLKESQVREIKKLLAEKQLSMAQIGRLCDVPASTIASIKYGESWKHVS